MKLTLKSIKELKQECTNALAKYTWNYVINRWRDYDDKKHIFTDVLHHGCVSGIVGELVYYADTVAFYEKYKKEINELLYEAMKLLKLHENALREFEDEDVINQSENGGILYWMDEKQKQYVKAFELKYNAVVYHVIHDYTEIGEMLAFLYISKHKEEWKADQEDIKHGIVLAYVKNLDDETCSEFGSIGIKPQFGGLIRKA